MRGLAVSIVVATTTVADVDEESDEQTLYNLLTNINLSLATQALQRL